MIKRRLLIPPKGSFTGWEHLELFIMTLILVLILKVTISSLFRLIHTFTVMFGSPSTRVLSSVAAIPFFWVLFIWPDKFRTCLLYYSPIFIMCSVLNVGLLQPPKMGTFEKIFGSFTYYLLSHGVACYLVSGFRNPSLISIHILFSYHYYYHSQSIYV